MPSGTTLAVGGPLGNQPPASNYATFDTRNTTNPHPLLDFDQSTDEAACWTFVMPRVYSNLGVTLTIKFAATGITTGNVIWEACFELLENAAQDIDSDGFASTQASAATAVAGTDGAVANATITFTDGAQMDSVTAGSLCRLKINRDANNGSDTAAADAELVSWELKET